jgi:hypothetical protein
MLLNRDARRLLACFTGLLAGLIVALLPAAHPQADSPRKADSIIGEVAEADFGARRLTLKVDAGGTVEVTVQEGATVLRAKPGAPSLADATPVPLEQIAAGDRVLARGALSKGKRSLAARQLVLMTRDDIARKQEGERAEWRRRGVLGVVTAVDAAKGEITLRVGRIALTQSLVVETVDRKVAFRRYAPDSVKFTDARPSALGELRVGDQLRALGDRSPDGSRLAAEQVVFGTFRTVTGTVIAVDPAGSEVMMRADESRRAVTVRAGPDARVGRLPPAMGTKLARLGSGEGPDPGANGARLKGGRGAREPGAGPEDLLERLPATTLAELKPGDRILVASTEGSDPARLNAIALVAGLETLRPLAAQGEAAGPDVGLPQDLLDLGMSFP